MTKNRPFVIEIEDSDGPTPAEVPPVPDLGLPDGRAMAGAAAIAAAESLLRGA